MGIAEHFARPGECIEYTYDFGDEWRHRILLEGILLADPLMSYPACIGGEGACPPEDCGGPHGYERLLAILADPMHEEHEDTIGWLKMHAINYHPFRSSQFKAGLVRFSDPAQRWKRAFQGGE